MTFFLFGNTNDEWCHKNSLLGEINGTWYPDVFYVFSSTHGRGIENYMYSLNLNGTIISMIGKSVYYGSKFT